MSFRSNKQFKADLADKIRTLCDHFQREYETEHIGCQPITDNHFRIRYKSREENGPFYLNVKITEER